MYEKISRNPYKNEMETTGGMLLLTLPILSGALLLVLADLHSNTLFFDPIFGGDPIFSRPHFQELFLWGRKGNAVPTTELFSRHMSLTLVATNQYVTVARSQSLAES